MVLITDTLLFCFVTMHAFDRHTDRRTDRRTDRQKDHTQQDLALTERVLKCFEVNHHILTRGRSAGMGF